jgi:hypothetical protein
LRKRIAKKLTCATPFCNKKPDFRLFASVAQTTVFATPPNRGAIPVVRKLGKTLAQSWFSAPDPTIRSERRSLRGLTNGNP